MGVGHIKHFCIVFMFFRRKLRCKRGQHRDNASIGCHIKLNLSNRGGGWLRERKQYEEFFFSGAERGSSWVFQTVWFVSEMAYACNLSGSTHTHVVD